MYSEQGKAIIYYLPADQKLLLMVTQALTLVKPNHVLLAEMMKAVAVHLHSDILPNLALPLIQSLPDVSSPLTAAHFRQ